MWDSSLLLLLAAAAVQGAPSLFKRWDDQCTSFALPAIPENINATLAFARYYPAGALFNETDPNTSFKSDKITDFCRLRINITTSPTSQSISEVWLPDSWNNRFLGFGNGANGGVAWSEMAASGVNYGFASHATNGGHSSNGSSGVFAIGNPEALVDWHYRAMHQGTVVAKAVIASYYSTSSFHSYYGSCSAGGRQGWMSAERYPADYDSIIVGSPAVDDARQSASALWVHQKVLPVNGSTWFSNHTWAVLHDEVLRQCDEIDGLKDGVISNPLRCNFRPAAIACRPWQTNTTDCLTPAQLNTLRYIYEPWVDANDTYVYAGFPWGSELGMISGNLLPDGGAYGQDAEFYRHFVYNDSSWQANQISFSSVQLATTTVGDGNDSPNVPNITEFVSRGGKLIQFVGIQDQYLSPYASVDWHDEVDTWMTSHTNYTTEDYFRLFLIPGMKHCSGGNGANVVGQPSSYNSYPPVSTEPSHNMLFSLLDWYA
ncbi:feruloyl esterase-like protein [Pseudohyphozyma bogoriensis]|nr:feruloyl esterase-like protein [Pseudohyphozyma bogoriensis]